VTRPRNHTLRRTAASCSSSSPRDPDADCRDSHSRASRPPSPSRVVRPLNHMRELLLIVSLTLAACQSIAADSSGSPILQQAYDQLLVVRFFAFGDVDRPPATSTGERCFRSLAASTNGLPLFKAALTNGTTAARLYALCGVRHLAPEQFDALAAPVTTADARVSLMVGDMQMQMRASNLVAQIKRGWYDDCFPSETTNR
jgi:hypothetical protein